MISEGREREAERYTGDEKVLYKKMLMRFGQAVKS